MHAVVAAFRIYAQHDGVMKMLLKREVGGRALNSHGITSLIMETHGKIMESWF